MVTKARLWVALTWQDDVIYTASLTQGQYFSLGSSPGDWPFPPELLDEESYMLADFRGSAPKIRLPGGDWCLIQFGQRVETYLGAFRIQTVLEAFNDELRRWSQLQFELRPCLSWLGCAAAQISFLLAMVYSIPELTDIEPLPNEQTVDFPIVPIVNDARIVPSEDDESPGIATSKERYINPIPGQATRCAGYGMGSLAAPKANARYAVSGPKDNPDPHISRALATKKSDNPEVMTLGVKSPGELGDPKAPFAPWGRDSSLGTDEVSARGNMWGDRIDDSQGEDDIAEREVTGGLLKRIEVSRPPTQQERRPARVIHTQLSVQGALQSSDAESTIVGQLEAFRKCYRASPSSLGNEEGHVELALAIDAEGTVSDVNALRGEQIEPSVTSCLLERARELRFPARDASTQITYPLHFIPGIEPASPPVRTIPLAPAVEHERYVFSPCSGKRPGVAKKLQPCQR